MEDDQSKETTQIPVYKSAKEIKKEFGVSRDWLINAANSGALLHIRLPKGKRLYDIHAMRRLVGAPVGNEKAKTKIIYARVSSAKQKEDLERQIQDLQTTHPTHKVIKDIGSGINFKRKGFQTLLDTTMRGDVEEIVVAHRDRLCRFAFELVEYIAQKHGTKIVVQSASTSSETTEQELAEDLLAITTVFVARNNGLRAGKKRKASEAREAREAQDPNTPPTKKQNVGSRPEQTQDQLGN